MLSNHPSRLLRWVLPLAGITLSCGLPTRALAQVNSPPGGPNRGFRIVYHRVKNIPLAMDAPSWKNIYAVSSEGGGEEQLTEDNHSFHPVLSPDGTKIAYIHIKPETCEGCFLPAEYGIQVMNADGTAAHFVAAGAWPKTEMRWSPDGRTLAYTGLPAQAGPHAPVAPESSLYLVPPDGGESPRLMSRVFGGAFEWSPDGKWIAHGCPAPQKESRPRIRLCISETSKGGHSKILLEGALPNGFSWSPDGSRLAFIVADKKSSALFVAGTDDSSPRLLTKLNSVSATPQWSPDGKRIVFADVEHGKGAVCVMNADGAARQRLTEPKLRASNPMWSPSGTKIVCAGVVHDRLQSHLVNADGSELRAVTQDEKMECKNIAWLGDGKFLLLRCGYPQPSLSVSGEASNENLYVVAVDDPASGLRQLTNGGIGDISFAPVKPRPGHAGLRNP